MIRRPALAVVAVLALLGAACSDDGGPSAEATSTTTVAPSSDEPTTTTVPEVETALALRGDGLGLVAFGEPSDDVLAAVTEVLGEPTTDSGWVSASGPFGNCPGQQVRGVEWDGLQVLFSQADTDPAPGGRFLSWDLSGAPPALATTTGFGFGATADDAHDLYGPNVELIPAEDPYPAFLRVQVDGAEISAFLDDAGTVTNLHGGVDCGE